MAGERNMQVGKHVKYELMDVCIQYIRTIITPYFYQVVIATSQYTTNRENHVKHTCTCDISGCTYSLSVQWTALTQSLWSNSSVREGGGLRTMTSIFITLSWKKNTQSTITYQVSAYTCIHTMHIICVYQTYQFTET